MQSNLSPCVIDESAVSHKQRLNIIQGKVNQMSPRLKEVVNEPYVCHSDLDLVCVHEVVPVYDRVLLFHL